MRVFEYRDQLIADYAAYVRSFVAIRDRRIGKHEGLALLELLKASFLPSAAALWLATGIATD